MCRHLLFSVCILLSFNAFSQAGMNFVRNFGGTSTDMFVANALLRNGNLVSVGYTESTDGHGTGNHGDHDCLVICTSPEGILLWKKVIGGTDWDAYTSTVDTTADGNVVVGFTTGSTNGDIVGNHGNWDVALFKFTPDGNLIWKKIFGGSGTDIIGKVRATPDGGTIVSASSNSSASGDVTGVSHGSFDMWILKVDVNGNIQWQKLFGGSLNDRAAGENGGTIELASDGGYFFSTSSNSVDGDLAGLLPNGAVMGAYDLWLCHIDATGNILWSKNIGGSAEDNYPVLHSIGNSVYFGFTTKSADRDLLTNTGLYDIALFKYNVAGTLIWKTQYPGSAWDNLEDITSRDGDMLTMVGGTYSFLFCGYQMPAADERLFVTRIDTLNGSVKWLKALGGNGRSCANAVRIRKNGEILVSGLSTNTQGDIYANIGDYDGIVTSFAGGNRINGTVFIDANNNNTLDAGEEKPNHIMIRGDKNDQMFYRTSTRNGGQYSLEVDTGLYKVKTDLRENPYYIATPPDFPWQFSGNGEVYNKNIPLHAVPNIKDLAIDMVPISILRPGRPARYLLTGYNVGTVTIPTGTIGFRKDTLLTFSDFSVPPDYQNGDSIAWKFSNLEPFDSLNFVITMMLPTTAPGGIPMNYRLGIRPVDGDAAPANNTVYFRHIVVNSYDPNCKTNNFADSIPLASVQNEDYIYYTIQFQNTGTASAIDIFIKDTLSANLVDSTFQIVKMSHPGTLKMQKNVATWTFFNINLPDSNANEKASHGYIQYRVKPKKTLQVNDHIDNTAAIYFDFNPPVITENNRLTVYVPKLPPTPPAPTIDPSGNISFCTPVVLKATASTGNFQWYKDGTAINGATANTYTAQAAGSYTVKVTANGITSDASAATVLSAGNISAAVISKTNNVLSIQNPETGISYTWQVLNGATWTDIDPQPGNTFQVTTTGDYRVRSVKGLCRAVSALMHVEIISSPSAKEIRVYPNPALTKITVDQLANTEWETLEIISSAGKKMMAPVILNNSAEVTINVSRFAAGVYVVVLRNDRGQMKKMKFVKE